MRIVQFFSHSNAYQTAKTLLLHNPQPGRNSASKAYLCRWLLDAEMSPKERGEADPVEVPAKVIFYGCHMRPNDRHLHPFIEELPTS